MPDALRATAGAHPWEQPCPCGNRNFAMPDGQRRVAAATKTFPVTRENLQGVCTKKNCPGKMANGGQKLCPHTLYFAGVKEVNMVRTL